MSADTPAVLLVLFPIFATILHRIPFIGASTADSPLSVSGAVYNITGIESGATVEYSTDGETI